MVLCENCKIEIKEKKGKKIAIEEETGNIGLTLLLLAGAGVGGYFLWKKYRQPATAMQSPILSMPQSATQKEEENMIQID